MHQSHNLQRIILLKEVHWQNSGSVSLKWLRCFEFDIRHSFWKLGLIYRNRRFYTTMVFGIWQAKLQQIHDLAFLNISHPEIYREFENGNFSIQLSASSPFGDGHSHQNYYKQRHQNPWRNYCYIYNCLLQVNLKLICRK